MHMVKDEVLKIIQEIAPGEEIHLESPENEAFGDYSTNIALKGKDPRKKAEKVVNKLQKNEESNRLFEKIEIAGPGFINFWLKEDYLLVNLDQIVDKNEDYGFSNPNKGKKVMFEYGQPNTHKLPHIGHLFSYTYGEAMTRLLEATGWEVRRANYQGDVGLHVAKCLWAYLENKAKAPNTLEEKAALLQKMYQEGSKAYEENEEAKKGIQLINKKIYEKDPEILGLWEETRAWSLEYYKNFEKRLAITYDRYYYESEVQEKGKEKVLQNTPKVFKVSQGAHIFEGSKFGLHDRVFVTGEGNPTYEAKDLYLEELKFKEWPMDLLVITTANEQTEYFKVIFKALTEIHSEMRGKLKHIGFGMVNLKTGKMSSRTGEIVGAVELVDIVVKKVGEITSKNQKLKKEEAETISEAVGLGAVKYSFLKNNPLQDTRFDIEESIAAEGNSGPYLQYTVARTNSVLEKAKGDKKGQKKGGLNTEELAVVRSLVKFPETVLAATEAYSPNLLCNYLYNLAQKYNGFYNKHKIIGGENENLRILITEATKITLKKGLNLLGITTPERM